MLLRAIVSSALVAAPLAVSAVGSLGFAVGNTNSDGSCKSQSDYEADMQAIAANSDARLVRTYSSTDQFGNPCDTATHIMAAAKSSGFKVLIGMW